MKREELIEKMARAIWFAGYGKYRQDWRNKWPDDVADKSRDVYRQRATAALSAIEAAGMDRNSALEDAAKWCDQNVIAVGGGKDEPRYAGYIAVPSRHEIDNGRHNGMGYAAAIRAMKTER